MRRVMLRRFSAALAVLFGGLTVAIAAPQVASAHVPSIAVTTDCADDGWTATFVVSSDGDRGEMWNIEGRGFDTARPDTESFTVVESLGFAVPSYEYSSGVTQWWTSEGAVAGIHAGLSAIATRPEGCEPPVTTTTSTTTTSTTSTTTSTTSTTSTTTSTTSTTTEPPVCEYDPQLPPDDPDCEPPVCEYDPQLPPDHPDCDPPVCEYDPELPGDDPGCTPDVEISALCREYTLTDGGSSQETVGYWFDVVNPEPAPATLTYVGSGGPTNLALAAGGTARVRVDSTDPQFLFDGSPIDTPVPGEDCEMQLIVTKELDGPPPGEALYTVDIAYYDDGAETLILTFELSSQEPEVITLPASYTDPEGDDAIEYIVREVGQNQGTVVSYSPSDRFFGSGNVGEQVSVVITNAYAAVEIDKTVNDDVVEPGQIIFYEMIVSNTGGLPLENLEIDDLFPTTIFYVDYEIVGDGLPITCNEVPTPDGPDYLTCDAEGVLAPGATLPTIRVTAEVGPDAASVDHFDNQSRVVGDFVVDESGPATPSGFQRGAFGRSRGLTVNLSPVRVAAAPPPPGENLSCAPVEGQVCNVSPVVLAVGQVPGTPTTTIVGGGNLPETGSDGTGIVAVLAGTLLLFGSAALVITRRRAMS